MTDLLPDGDSLSWAELDVQPTTDDDLAAATPPENVAGDTPPRDVPVCEECGEPITSWKGKGRRPRFHPEHRPTKSSAGPRGERVPQSGKTKAEREADALATSFLTSCKRLALIVGTVEPYDGFALMAGAPELSRQYGAILATHDTLRKKMQQTSGSGSILGFVLAAALIAAPILAHHGVIPREVNGKPVGQLIEGIPRMYAKLEDAVNQHSQNLTEAMADAADAQS